LWIVLKWVQSWVELPQHSHTRTQKQKSRSNQRNVEASVGGRRGCSPAAVFVWGWRHLRRRELDGSPLAQGSLSRSLQNEHAPCTLSHSLCLLGFYFRFRHWLTWQWHVPRRKWVLRRRSPSWRGLWTHLVRFWSAATARKRWASTSCGCWLPRTRIPPRTSSSSMSTSPNPRRRNRWFSSAVCTRMLSGFTLFPWDLSSKTTATSSSLRNTLALFSRQYSSSLHFSFLSILFRVYVCVGLEIIVIATPRVCKPKTNWK